MQETVCDVDANPVKYPGENCEGDKKRPPIAGCGWIKRSTQKSEEAEEATEYQAKSKKSSSKIQPTHDLGFFKGFVRSSLRSTSSG